MKHTPGPWSIRYLSGLDMEIFSEHGRICSFSGFSHSIELIDWHEENERANAQLVSSAPDLLEALEVAAFRLECILDEGPDDAISLELKAIKSAINKAKGLPQQG